MNTKINSPLGSAQNAHLELLGQCGSYRRKRKYTKAQIIVDLAIAKYTKNGKGITFNDLIANGLANHKNQAQNTLKRCVQKNIIFAPANYKPQEYYPTCLKAEILSNKISKNAPIRVTEVAYSSRADFMNLESTIIQSLESYVLPLLPSAPLHIHRIQLRLKVSPEYYKELKLPIDKGNYGKQHVEIIGKVRVSYHFYANGTVMVFTESSGNPFKIEDETDRSRLLAFFGQIRDRLVTFLQDKHERIVPDIMEWDLTQCDINKDVRVSDWLQITGLKVQLKHFDHLLRVYIKSMGRDTVCRVEESLNLKKKPIVQALSEILPNPNVKSQQSSASDDDRRKITEIHDMLKTLLNLLKHDSDIEQEPVVGGIKK